MRVCCWAEADATLAELARLDRRLAAIEEQRAHTVATAVTEAERSQRPLRERHTRLSTALERYCRKQEPELSRTDGHRRRSRRLLFGRVGFRGSQAVVIADEAKALRALAHWRTGQRFLRVHTELDREALRYYFLEIAARLSPTKFPFSHSNHDSRRRPQRGRAVVRRLRRAGIALQQRENWFYELDWAALNHWG